MVNRIVALVGDDVITMDELDAATRREEQRIAKDFSGRELKQKIYELKKQYLDALITEKLVEKEIKRLGIAIPDQEVDEQSSKWLESNGVKPEQKADWLESQGLTPESFRDMFRSKMHFQILVSEDEITKYYEAHKEDFVPKNRVHLKTILIKANLNEKGEITEESRRKIEEIRSLILTGSSFEITAIRYSEGPNALAGGDASWIDWKVLNPKLREVIDTMQAGDVSPVVLIDQGTQKWFQIVKLVEREKEGQMDMDKVRERISNLLSEQKRDERQADWLKKLRETYFVKVKL
jgi:peptidyl-prolyl cis-trans isomerase SurA